MRPPVGWSSATERSVLYRREIVRLAHSLYGMLKYPRRRRRMILVGGNSPVQGFTGRARAASLALGDQIMLWMPSASGENAIKGVNIVRLPNWGANQDTISYLHDISSTVS